MRNRDVYRRRSALGGTPDEFGIFGGPDGGWLLQLLALVDKPVATTMHTVLPKPSADHVALVRAISAYSRKVVVLSRTAQTLLQSEYGISADNIAMIPHGIPDVPFQSTARAKALLGLADRFVLSTFGLISRGKGLETAIDAISLVVRRHPKLLYVILGATHPVVRQHEGESYRTELQQRIAAAGLSEHVMMVDRYLALPDLLDYLAATDVYVTPYVNEAQIVSGTLAYAVGAGKPIVSTPYLYARELSANGRGAVVPFNDSKKMASSIRALVENDSVRERMAQRAYAFGRTMLWSEVGREYAAVFRGITEPAARPSYVLA